MTQNNPHVIDALTRIGSTSNGMSCRSETDSRLSHVDPTPICDSEISSVVSFFFVFAAAVFGLSPCCVFILIFDFDFRSLCSVRLCPW